MEISTFLDLFVIKREYEKVPRKKVINGEIELNGEIYTNLIKIGSGYNADVYCCYKQEQEGQEAKDYVLKVGNPVALAVEFQVYIDLESLGFNVVPTYHFEDFNALSKPYLDLNYFGNKIINNLTEIQKEELRKLWKKSCQYALVTGIPLDLKADNLWWDVKLNKWFIVDTGPKLDDDDPDKFSYTLDLKNADNFISRLQGKKTESSERITFISKSDVKNIYLNLKDFTLQLSAERKINYDYALYLNQSRIPGLVRNYLKSKSKSELSAILFFLKFLPVSKEILDLIATNISLSKKVCEVLSICQINSDINPDINLSITQFKDTVSKITDLRKDTAKYHSSLSYNEKKVLDGYTHTEYRGMNSCLRDGNETLDCPNYLQKIITLDKILTNPDAPRLRNNLTVYRGINEYKDSESQKIALALKNLTPGDYWEDRGFVSTSVQHPPQEFVGKTCCIFEIYLPIGTPAYYIGEDSSVSHEEEVILLPGILLQFVEQKKILYRGERNVNAYVFKCTGCGNISNVSGNTNKTNRFMLSHAPQELKLDTERLKYQPQERMLGKNKLALYHLTNMYNKFIPKKSKNTLRVMTWNVHEWRDSKKSNKQEEILNVIKQMNPDVLGLQEVTKKVTETTQSEKYNLLECVADRGSYGENLRNSLIVKKTIKTIREFKTSIKHDRCMVVYGISIMTDSNISNRASNNEKGKEEMDESVMDDSVVEKKILIANMHLDVASSEKRLENIRAAVKYIEEISQKEGIKDIIIMGDFNSYNNTDYNNTELDLLIEMKKNYSGKEIFEVVNYLEEKGYRDTFGLQRSKGQEIPANTNIYGGRIDFVFLSKGFSLPLKSSYVYYNDFSDHVAIVVDFDLGKDIIGEPVVKEKEKITNNPKIIKELKSQLNEKLYKAVDKGNLKKVQELGEKGANIHYLDDYALRKASAKGYLEMVKYLVEKGADIHARNEDALIGASEYGHLEIVKYLTEQGADIHADNDAALKSANQYGHTEVVQYLESVMATQINQSNIYKKKTYSGYKNKLNIELYEAVNKGNFEKMKELIEQGADIDYLDSSALRTASRKGYLEIVKYLVEKGANIHAQEDHPVRWASKNGHLAIVKYLVEKGANINSKDSEALKMATEFGHTDVVKYLQSLK